MSSAGKRERSLPCYATLGSTSPNSWPPGPATSALIGTGKQLTVSESHPRNRKTGNYDAGGPFYTSRVSYFFKAGHVHQAYSFVQGRYYTGPVGCSLPTSSEMTLVGFANPTLKYGDSDESSLKSLGTTAISLTSPTNSASNLGTSLAESHREGLPSLPGIPTWRDRTSAARAAGSEYLNAEFGWLPLVDEVNNVVNTARNSVSLMKQYQANEGRNTHRGFTFPSQRGAQFADMGKSPPDYVGLSSYWSGLNTSRRTVSVNRETRRWFSGSYTYALPSSSDKWGRMLGIGSEADRLYGLALTPDVLWELTPWSWAVDWFSNAGDVINNVTNFGLAGLVLRYGYMMEESIETITAEVGPALYNTNNGKGGEGTPRSSSPCSSGIEIVTKRRVPSSPFGFSIGWSGLSPTQLAITAALGITRLL